MAIAFATSGSVTPGSTSITTAAPASVAIGDLLILPVANKYPTNGPTTPTGWTLGLQASGGAGASGVDTGNVYMTVFYRVADGTADDTPTLSIPSGNSAVCRMSRYTCAAGCAWALAFASGTDSTGGVDWSATANANPGIVANDLMVICTAVNGDAYTTVSLHAITCTGVTFGTVTERADSGATNGDDCGLWVATAPVTAGPASAAPVYTAVAAATSTDCPAGVTVFVRLREFDNTGTASIAMADLTVTATGTNTDNGAAAITLAGDTVVAAGTNTNTGTASIAMADLTVTATGTNTDNAAAAITFAADTVGATGTVIDTSPVIPAAGAFIGTSWTGWSGWGG